MRSSAQVDTCKATRRMAWAVLLLWTVGCDARDNQRPTGLHVPAQDGAVQNENGAVKPQDGAVRNEDGAVRSGAADAPAVAEGGLSCAMHNLTRRCECQQGETVAPGRQTCSGETGWGQCECATIPGVPPGFDKPNASHEVAENTGPKRFQWDRTPPPGGGCEPGIYEGLFDGLYNPQVTVALSFGFWTTIAIFGVVQFALEEEPASGGEILEIANGHFVGSAFMPIPFEARLSGTLDCRTGAFEGVLKDGFYMVGFDKYAFSGVIKSNYDVISHTFVDGVWSVTEPDNALIESPLVPPEGFPHVEDLDFPDPLEVEPAQPLPAPYPPGFRGGVGTWWASLLPL